jgi:hypothetical protein
MKDTIKKLKYLRFKPEERYIVDILINIKLYKSDLNNYLYFKCNDEIIFRYNKGINALFVETNIWNTILDKYKIEFLHIPKLLSTFTKVYLKIRPKHILAEHTIHNIEKLNLKLIE